MGPSVTYAQRTTLHSVSCDTHEQWLLVMGFGVLHCQGEQSTGAPRRAELAGVSGCYLYLDERRKKNLVSTHRGENSVASGTEGVCAWRYIASYYLKKRERKSGLHSRAIIKI